MNQIESYKPHFNRALIQGKKFLILIFVQQYSTLGIETKVVKRKNTKNTHCSWKSHIYMVTKSLGDLLSKMHFLCVCFLFFFCCPTITFVKLITLGWIFIFYWKRTLFLLLVCFGLHKNVEKRASNWSSVNLIERLQALCTRCARAVHVKSFLMAHYRPSLFDHSVRCKGDSPLILIRQKFSGDVFSFSRHN